MFFLSAEQHSTKARIAVSDLSNGPSKNGGQESTIQCFLKLAKEGLGDEKETLVEKGIEESREKIMSNYRDDVDQG